MTSSELRAMVEAATPGPWLHDGEGSAHVYAAEQGDPGWYRDVASTEENTDAALIALAPSLALALVEAWGSLELVRNTLNVSPRAAADLDGLRDDVERALARLEELGA